MPRKRKTDNLTSEEALTRLLFSETGSFTKTAQSLGCGLANVKRWLGDELSSQKELTSVKERRVQILKMFYAGKTYKEISQITGIEAQSVYKVIYALQCLDNLEDIKIVPHKPFPAHDDFQLLPIHRERLEKLREAKVRKYYELNGQQEKNS